MTSVRKQLIAVKEQRIYEIADAPDIKPRKFTIRPDQLTAHVYDDELVMVVIDGYTVRRDRTQGARRSGIWAAYMRDEPCVVPAWIEDLLTAERLTWRAPRKRSR